MRLDPGSAVGVIGGGQLGRMFILEARRMGYRSAVIDPDLTGPAAQVADKAFHPDQAASFVSCCQVATYEFEHVGMELVRGIEEMIPVMPKAAILEVKRNRVSEKTWLAARGFPVAPFSIFKSGREISQDKVDLPVVVKTATGGYDGKGLTLVKTQEDLARLKNQLDQEIIVEKFIPYAKEISVICARGGKGEVALYPPGENVHDDGILFHTLAPADLTRKERERAHVLAGDLAATLELVGVMGVEMFLLADGEILINEFAPRPHNSGHFTMDGCSISQFEMQLRAICGQPLDQPELLCPTAMLNILGRPFSEIPWEKVFGLPGVKVHLYGKAEARARRKMGHVNILGGTRMEVVEMLGLLKDIFYPGQAR